MSNDERMATKAAPQRPHDQEANQVTLSPGELRVVFSGGIVPGRTYEELRAGIHFVQKHGGNAQQMYTEARRAALRRSVQAPTWEELMDEKNSGQVLDLLEGKAPQK